MCGIVGCIEKEKRDVENLLKRLKKLDYRGYDSSGIGILSNEIEIYKEKGQIDNLLKETYGKQYKLAIAHTRWATHGEATKENAHPFLSNSKRFSLVHNGIIENYKELKEKLKNYTFSSQTDSEVVCNLLDYFKGSTIDRLKELLKVLKGSYALVIIDKLDKNSLYLLKNNSPLFVAKDENRVVASSDAVCFLDFAKDFYTLKDKEIAKISLDNLTFFDKNGKKIRKFAEKLQIFDENSNFKGSFMLKEILEEEKVLDNIKNYIQKGGFKKFDLDYINRFNKIIFIGCGSAYHAGLLGAKFVRKFLKINSFCEVASEFANNNYEVDKNTLIIFVSQSGETADTIKCLKYVKKFCPTTLALTNVAHSTLRNLCHDYINVCAGVEVAVASTKAFIAQVLILYLLCKHFKFLKKGKTFDYKRTINNVKTQFKKTDFCYLDSLAKQIKDKKDIVFIGRNYDYITSLEAALKLKEVSYINTSSYPAGELKHGFLAVVDKNSTVFALVSENKLYHKTLSNISEIESRKGKTYLFSIKEGYKIENLTPELNVLTISRALQYLAYKVSTLLGLSPDKPRNLAKSVTVE